MVDQKTAQRAGIAFKLGVAFGRGGDDKRKHEKCFRKLRELKI